MAMSAAWRRSGLLMIVGIALGFSAFWVGSFASSQSTKTQFYFDFLGIVGEPPTREFRPLGVSVLTVGLVWLLLLAGSSIAILLRRPGRVAKILAFVSRHSAAISGVVALSLGVAFILVSLVFLTHRAPPPPVAPVRPDFVARLEAPSRLYAGKSAPVVLSVDRIEYSGPVRSRDWSKGHALDIHADVMKLQAELLAAGVLVDGERKQIRLLTSPPAVFEWNCHFKDSGEYTLTLVLSGIDKKGEVFPIGTSHQDVVVPRIDHLTDRHLMIIAGIVGFVSFISTILGVLKLIRELRTKKSAASKKVKPAHA